VKCRKGRIRLAEKENNFEQETEKFEEEVTSETETKSETEVAELKQKLEDLEDQNLRLQAEIQNMRRRNKKKEKTPLDIVPKI
jgi:Molecular chaperone GrpE (heat shock protein)